MEIPQEILVHISAAKLPMVIGISGFGGAGKSSFAKALGQVTGLTTISVDSFQKDGAFDSDYSLWEIMDFTRLEREVLKPFLEEEKIISYGHFDAPSGKISEVCSFTNTGCIIVEGVGLFRPDLLKYMTLKIWIDCPIETAIARGKKRDSQGSAPCDQLWEGIWKDNDLQYFETYKPKDVADFIVSNC